MHKLKIGLFTSCLFIILNLLPGNVQGQCSSFAKNICKPKLENFVHDGNYNATILGAGETAELYKTFFAGQTYRIVVGKINDLPSIHFRLVDESNQILFDNKDHNFIDVWDFSVETTQMLVIKLKVLDNYNSNEENVTKGCVAVLFGIEKDKKEEIKTLDNYIRSCYLLAAFFVPFSLQYQDKETTHHQAN